jgi:glycosyltransferase involved in cell wall biosynthesis
MPVGRPRLLYLLHAYFNRAGTEEHTKLLAEELAEHYEIALLFPHDGKLWLRSEDGTAVQYPMEPFQWPATPYLTPVTNQSVREALARFRPDVIHVQHFFNLPLGVLDLVTDFTKRAVISFHDYYPITPLFTMQGVTNPEHTFTKKVSLEWFGADLTDYLGKRRQVLQRSLSRFAMRICPSQYLAQVLGQIYPETYAVINHGIRPFAREVAPYTGPGFRFGYVGSFLPQKGWVSLLQAFPAVRDRFPEAELHFFGGGHHYDGPPVPGLEFHGPYDQHDLPQVCSQFHVGVIPSIFAETFCLVLSELWYAGLPVAAAAIGALPERIQNNVNGRLFPPGDSPAITETLSSFFTDTSWRSWSIAKPRLVSEMVSDYRSVYDALLKSNNG